MQRENFQRMTSELSTLAAFTLLGLLCCGVLCGVLHQVLATRYKVTEGTLSISNPRDRIFLRYYGPFKSIIRVYTREELGEDGQ